MTWAQVVAAAAGTTVVFAAEHDPGLDPYIDNFLAPVMLRSYGINLTRLPLNGHCDGVDRVWAANKTGAPGTVDIAWVKGDQFANLTSAGLLYGPFSTVLPASPLYSVTSPLVANDFGSLTSGQSLPYNAAQIVLIYNPRLVLTPPLTMRELLAWIGTHPGLFGWPVPLETNDATSAALLRMAFGAFCPYAMFATSSANAASLLAGSLYAQCTGTLWASLNDLTPHLYGYNATFGVVFPPASMSDVDALFANGSIAWTWSYDPHHAASMVSSGAWPAGNVSTTLLDGTVAHFDFVGVPRSAPNLLGALVLANELAMPAQVYARAKPELAAKHPAADVAKLPSRWADLLADLSSFKSPLSPALSKLATAALVELPLNVQKQLEVDWTAHVGRSAGMPFWHGVHVSPSEPGCFNPPAAAARR